MKVKRKLNKTILYGLVGIAIGAASIVQASNTERISHIVKLDENLWRICEVYYDEKNLSEDMEFIEFYHQVERENSWLQYRHYQLKPNDKIEISYKKKNPHDTANIEGNRKKEVKF